MLDAIIKLAGLGAVGVAAISLLLSHKSYGALLKLVADPKHKADQKTLETLAIDLRDYRRMAIYALIAAVVVQLSEPVLARVFPGSSPRYAMAITVEPTDGLDKERMPIVKREGRTMAPASDGAFVAEVDSRTNFSVQIHGLRTMMDELRKVNANIAQAQVVAVQADPAKRPIGFDPAP
jgi:hypothetical protein